MPRTVKDTRTIHIFVEDCKYYLIPDEGNDADCDHMKNESCVCNRLRCPINTYLSYPHKIEEYYPDYSEESAKDEREEKWAGVLEALPILEHSTGKKQVYGYLKNLNQENYKLMLENIKIQNTLDKIRIIAKTQNIGDVNHLRGQLNVIITLVSKEGKS